MDTAHDIASQCPASPDNSRGRVDLTAERTSAGEKAPQRGPTLMASAFAALVAGVAGAFLGSSRACTGNLLPPGPRA